MANSIESSVLVSRLFNSAAQVKLLASQEEILSLCPEMGLRTPTGAHPLHVSLGNGKVLVLDGYPTGSLNNQSPAVRQDLLKALGAETAVEFDAEITAIEFGSRLVREGAYKGQQNPGVKAPKRVTF